MFDILLERGINSLRVIENRLEINWGIIEIGKWVSATFDFDPHSLWQAVILLSSDQFSFVFFCKM